MLSKLEDLYLQVVMFASILREFRYLNPYGQRIFC